MSAHDDPRLELLKSAFKTGQAVEKIQRTNEVQADQDYLNAKKTGNKKFIKEIGKKLRQEKKKTDLVVDRVNALDEARYQMEKHRGNYNSDDFDSSEEGDNHHRNDNNDDNQDGDRYDGGDTPMKTQCDTIFIQNLPHNVTEEELGDVFNHIGVVKNDKKTGTRKIWIHKNKTTGEGNGEATISYESKEAAQAAINLYNGKEVLSNVVKITFANRVASAFGDHGEFRDDDGFCGRGAEGGVGDHGDCRDEDRDGNGNEECRGSDHGASYDSSGDKPSTQ